jgi:AcrR family transcriptional regulator
VGRKARYKDAGMAAKKRAIAGEKTKLAAEPRKRRSPDEARTLLMDAAERVFMERTPDTVGLRDVAGEAGVSHGLITHYFKTYEGLVEAVFTRRTHRVTERAISFVAEMKGTPTAAGLIDLMLGVVTEPIHLRLVAWSMLTGRALQADFIAGRKQGLEPIAAAIHKAAVEEAKQRGTPQPSRDDVDYALLLAIGAAYSWGIGKGPFLSALDRKLTPRSDQEVMTRLRTMVRALIAPTK